MVATSNTVTVFGFIFPAVLAAIVAIGVAVWKRGQEDARLRNQESREDARRRSQERAERVRELGQLADECGAAVTQALFAFDRRRVSPASEFSETGTEFHRRVEAVRLMDNRVAQRLGPAYDNYRKADAALHDLSDLIWNAHGSLNEEDDAKATLLRDDVENARDAFLAEARQLLDAERMSANAADHHETQ